MTNPPFGFGPGSGAGDPNDPQSAVPAFAELQRLMSQLMSSSADHPVNWDLARQVATARLAADATLTRPSTGPDRTELADALRLADLWLDDATDLPSGLRSAEAWSAAEWVDKTLPVWSTLCDPIAGRVSGALAAALPEELRPQTGPLSGPLAGQLSGLMTAMGGMMFGTQVGQALGSLSAEVLTGSDIGLPLTPTGVAVLLPRAIAAFGAGLDRPAEEVRLYLALREAAHQRLFTHVPWLRQRLLDTVEGYARGITIDTDAMHEAVERAMVDLDPSNPEGIQQAISGGLFEPQETPEQKAAVRRLETLLALIEGWVDAVVTAAAEPRLPGAAALRETLRRRRATGGPAEQTFATLVGLELRPRRLREAAALWTAMSAAHGQAGRDALWGHPDLLPSADDLDDPEGFVARGDDGDLIAQFSAELAKAAEDGTDRPAPDESDSGPGDGDPGPADPGSASA
jgi:putative hydrolase